MKRIKIITSTVCLMLLLTSCGHEHTWKEATCIDPKTCESCGETEGEALGHTWKEATCTEPKTCEICGITEGEPIGHTWKEATCVEPKTCEICGETEGKELGHTWKEATCTEAKTCEICGETEGTELGHTVNEWEIIEPASCSAEGNEKGTCVVCGEELEQIIPMTEHTPGEWVITEKATSAEAGKQALQCAVCGAEMETKSYELSEEEIKKEYITKCTAYTYKEIARDPDKYIGTYGKYTGEVVQVLEDGDDIQMRVNITKGYFYTDTIFVFYTKKAGESRILEDDIVTIYGMNMGTISYETVMGATVTIPSVYASYIDIQ